MKVFRTMFQTELKLSLRGMDMFIFAICMPVTLQKISDLLPLTQGIKLLKAISLGLPMDSVLVSVFIMTIIAIICIGASIRFFKWE